MRCGGKSQNLGGGRYVPATVVTNVDHTMKLMTDETFGPVTPVMKFRSVDEAVSLANDTVYGLSGAVFAGTLEEARAVAERVNAGGMSLNDAGLTRETYEAEKHSFGYSGTGGSRHGDAGLIRFFRKKAMLDRPGARELGLNPFSKPTSHKIEKSSDIRQKCHTAALQMPAPAWQSLLHSARFNNIKRAVTK